MSSLDVWKWQNPVCRRSSEKAMREVRELESRGLACLRLHAAKYVEALLPPAEPGSSQPCVPSAVRDFCEEAVKQPLQQEQMGLLSDPTAVRCSVLDSSLTESCACQAVPHVLPLLTSPATGM